MTGTQLNCYCIVYRQDFQQCDLYRDVHSMHYICSLVDTAIVLAFLFPIRNQGDTRGTGCNLDDSFLYESRLSAFFTESGSCSYSSKVLGKNELAKELVLQRK